MSDDPMAEIRASFFIECEELLEALQDGLMRMEEGEGEADTVNVIFRAVHSIKGGAGAFGLDELVRFAHRYETVLDEVRNNNLTADSDVMKIFFLCADHLSDLVRMSRDGDDIDTTQSDALLERLDKILSDAGIEEEEEVTDFQPAGLSLLLDPPPSDAKYVIRFVPDTDLFLTGNEPLHLLRSLAALGEAEIECDSSKVPDLEQIAPETPYLGWTIKLTTPADEGEIREIFEFVEGLCVLEIECEERPEADVPELNLDALLGGGDEAPDIPVDLELPSAAPELDDDPVILPDAAASPSPVAAVAAPRDNGGEKQQNAAPKAVVRVDLERIERLVNLVGELVINQAMLSQSLENSAVAKLSDVMNGLEEYHRLTRDIQDSVMMIRAQPVKSLFQRMSRIVREASAAVNKDVKLVAEGENTEVDKTVIERLSDPLTHMIRNSVDHGIESREKRQEAGKPAHGTVRLSAAHRSGRVVIEISDDGAGINRERVHQIAVEKGLIPPEAVLSDTEIDNLLFMPGFSTAKEVSNLSGRGVGMDVVKTAIQGLGGRITTTSVPGEGTTFSISLPLTLAVLDGMVIKVADETLVVPLNLVDETLSLTADDVKSVGTDLNVVQVRGSFVPLFDLGAALGYRAPLTTHEGSIVLLIAFEDGNRAALLIDGIDDQRQVVIKGLDDTFHRARGIAAATILGDGQIALILDPSDLIAQSSGRIRAEAI